MSETAGCVASIAIFVAFSLLCLVLWKALNIGGDSFIDKCQKVISWHEPGNHLWKNAAITAILTKIILTGGSLRLLIVIILGVGGLLTASGCAAGAYPSLQIYRLMLIDLYNFILLLAERPPLPV